MKNILFSIITISVLSGCGSSTAPESTTSAEAPAHQPHQTVVFTADQLPKAGITLEPAVRKDIVSPLTVNGTVAVLPDGKATVTSKMAGRVEQFFVHEGQNVEKGQALMSIASSAIFDIQQAYLQAKADLIFLEKELERQKTLSSQQVGATKNYEEIQSRYARAQGDLQTAAAKLSYLGVALDALNQSDRPQLAKTITVRAPLAGNITAIDVNLGASVGEGGVLCSIVGITDLHAHVEVFAKDIAQVQVGQPVTIRFPHTNIAQITTKIEYISRDISPETKTYGIHIHLPVSKGNYLPGMPLVADIHAQSVAALAVPESAVLVDGTETYCFIQESQNGQETTFRKIIFEPVLRGGGWVGLPEDLFKGKSIVVTGANLVDGEMRKSEME